MGKFRRCCLPPKWHRTFPILWLAAIQVLPAVEEPCFAVYAQSFSETRITDGQPSSTRTTAKYLTLTEYDGSTASRSFRTWQLARKKYTLVDDADVVSTCAILNQGTRKTLVSYWNSFPAGRHFSWSTGPLKNYPLSPSRTVQLPSTVLTRGIGVPKDAESNLKEYSVVGVLDLPATQYINALDPADDTSAEAALKAYYVSKGFQFE